MTVVSTEKDAENLTLTVVADFGATPEQVWELWEDPRKLERWWGPPTYPATFPRHDFVVGGESRYFMTGPDGENAPRLVANRGDRQAPPARVRERSRRG